MRNIALLTMILFASCSCQADVTRVLQFENQGIKIVCNVEKIEIEKVSEKEKKLFKIKNEKRTIVHANLKLTNSSNQQKVVNLKNYRLLSGNSKSSEIYIDSIADWIILDKKLNPKETYSANVYWVFDEELSSKDLGQMELIFSPFTQ